MSEKKASAEIRFAGTADLPRIMEIVARAQKFMADGGNLSQWQDGYPNEEIFLRDIDRGVLRVVESGGNVCAVFAFIVGEDPTYALIEGGEWLSGDKYGTIHRVASDGSVKGIFELVLDYCRKICPHIRVDTHRDNAPMLYLMDKYGFSYRGIIYVADGTPRMAFELL